VEASAKAYIQAINKMASRSGATRPLIATAEGV
jgi:hypothetical protein